MKTLRLTESGFEKTEINARKFQVWQGGSCIMQVIGDSVFWISNSRNFRWATNFNSIEEAMNAAQLWLSQKPKYRSGLKIKSGNILFAEWRNFEWAALEKPVATLL